MLDKENLDESDSETQQEVVDDFLTEVQSTAEDIIT